MADIMFISNYYHFIYVPIFPTGKEVNIICQECGLKRFGAGFNSKTFMNFEEIKHRYRNPWYTYFGVGIGVILFRLAAYFSILRA